MSYKKTVTEDKILIEREFDLTKGIRGFSSNDYYELCDEIMKFYTPEQLSAYLLSGTMIGDDGFNKLKIGVCECEFTAGNEKGRKFIKKLREKGIL